MQKLAECKTSANPCSELTTAHTSVVQSVVLPAGRLLLGQHLQGFREAFYGHWRPRQDSNLESPLRRQ